MFAIQNLNFWKEYFFTENEAFQYVNKTTITSVNDLSKINLTNVVTDGNVTLDSLFGHVTSLTVSGNSFLFVNNTNLSFGK